MVLLLNITMSMDKSDAEILMEAYIMSGSDIFKNIVEILWRLSPIKKMSKNAQVSIKHAIFKVTASGIHINVDHQDLILTNIFLDAKGFTLYKYNHTQPEFNIGVSLNPLKTFFGDVQKNKNVVFRVRKAMGQTNPTDIEIGISDDDNCSKGYILSITNEQNLNINACIENMYELTSMDTPQFVSLCKFVGNKNHIINIKSDSSRLVFSKSQVHGMDISWMSCSTSIPNHNYKSNIKSEYIKYLNKMSSFGTTIQIMKNEPYVIFKSNILSSTIKAPALKKNHNLIPISLGTIDVWIKTEPQLANGATTFLDIEY